MTDGGHTVGRTVNKLCQLSGFSRAVSLQSSACGCGPNALMPLIDLMNIYMLTWQRDVLKVLAKCVCVCVRACVHVCYDCCRFM
jgi:hypothetical protein